MKYIFWVLLLASQLCLAQDNSEETPFSSNLQNLSLSVGEIVSEIDLPAGQQLQAQVIELARLTNNRPCSFQVGTIEAGPEVKVKLAAYDIPGAPYDDQILALANDVTEINQIRDQIYPFINLVAAYAQSINASTLNDLSSTDLAQKLSEFAATRHQLYLPKGLLLVAAIKHRINLRATNMAQAFSGVSELSLEERTDILHHMAAAIDSDSGAGSNDFQHLQRVATYFTHSGFSQGIVIKENHNGQTKYSILVQDPTSKQFIKHTYMPTARTFDQKQDFFNLNGESVEASNIPLEYRPLITQQLLSNRPPAVWSEYQSNQPNRSAITVQPPTVAVVPATTQTSTTVAAPVIQGLDQVTSETSQNSLAVTGDASITATGGSLAQPLTYSPTAITDIATTTEITQINIPNYLNPQADIRREQNNILGVTNLDAPVGTFTQTSLSSVAASQGVVARFSGSTNNGQVMQGLSGLVETGSDGSTFDASGFLQNSDNFGVTGRYQSGPNGTIIDGRSFFSVDTGDTSDSENPVRGVRVTGIANYSIGTTNSLNGILSADIPVGDNDTVRTVTTLDDQQGITNVAGSYRTNITEDTSLSVAAATGIAGQSTSMRLETPNTIVTGRTVVNSEGNRTNAVALGRDLDAVLPESMDGYALVEIENGDTGSRTSGTTTFSVTPGVLLSDSGRIVMSANQTQRNDAEGNPVQSQSSQTFAVTDSVGMINWDLSYVNNNSRTPVSTSDRDSVTARLTYGVDRNGAPIDGNDGIVGSVENSYTTERNQSEVVSEQGSSEQYRLSATAGYSSTNPNNQSSLSVTGGVDYLREVIRSGGTIISEREETGFRLGAEYERRMQRRSANCSTKERVMVGVAGVETANPVECRVSFIQRF